jgi:hypothetical protein
MTRFPLILLAFVLLALSAEGQKAVEGTVTDSESGQPVPGASVFLSNTSVGTTANAKGAFTILIPAGRFELVVSSVGYETHSRTVQVESIHSPLAITLKPRPKELATVIIEPFEKNGWEKWGRFFTDNFIGTSAEARNCVIRNRDVIRFRYSKERGELTAIALEPLLIENSALGYVLKYQLEDFSYDFDRRYLYYGGYPLFTEMTGSAAKRRRWEKTRRELYAGSLLHFMRAVFTNTLAENDFEAYRLVKIPNRERQRVKAANQNRVVRKADGSLAMAALPADTADYYNRVMAQGDHLDVAGNQLLTGDSIAYAVNASTAGVDFPDYLLVIYKKGLAPAEYSQQFPKNGTALMSQINLVNGRPIEVQANGSYFQPADLLSYGYWAWSEKIARMLPYDYQPKQ